MKIVSNKREGNKVYLEIEEDYSLFEQAVNRALAEASREVKLPGFRPGKAPPEMVERAVDRSFLERRAAQDLIAKIYPKIIEETKIEPVDYPNVEILRQEKGKPFTFKITVEVYPEVKLGKYKGLKIEKRAVEITEEEVLKVLGNLQERFAVIGADGKKELLPLDDEFAKKISRYGTLAELKEEIRLALLREKTSEVEGEVRNKLIAAVSSEAKVDVPAAMIEREIDIMLDELRTSLAQSNLTLEDYLRGAKKEESTLRDELRKSAEIRVRGKVVLRAVAEAEKMKISPEELREELKSLADSSGQTLEEFEKQLGEDARKYIEEYLLRKKALDFLVEKANIKEVKP